jgi:flagellar L-ring protein precursor FlgH
MLDDMGLYDSTQYPPTYPADYKPPKKTKGTIYQSGYEMSLYQDHIAHRIGDILTVKLEEATQGQKQAETKTSKISSINTNDGTTSNNPSTENSGSLQPVFFGSGIKQLMFNNGSDQEFDGKGQANQSNRLFGTISVTVVRVLSNGNLVIQGESWVTINQGREFVRLTGIVRSEDIDSANIVSSQRIANARIGYSGAGQVGNATRGGIITQLFNKFFPY